MGGLFRSGSEEGNSPGERCGEVDAAQLPIDILALESVDIFGGLIESPCRALQRSPFFHLVLAGDAERRIRLCA